MKKDLFFFQKHSKSVRLCKVVRYVYLKERYMQREFLAKLCFIDENKLHKVFPYRI